MWSRLRTAGQGVLGNLTTNDRDVHGQATKVTQPDPDGPSGPLQAFVTQFSYDTRGNVLQVTNPDGTHDTITDEPSFSRPTSSTYPLGRKTLWKIIPTNRCRFRPPSTRESQDLISKHALSPGYSRS